MKAVVYTQYGPPDVLHLEEVAKPTPKDNEVLIRVCATSVTTGDVNARNFLFVPRGFGMLSRLMFGLRKPRRTILGMDLSGDIEAVGNDVTLFRKGDRVFGSTGDGFGAHAEYACIAEDATLAAIPVNVSHEEAAALPFGAATALFFLRNKANLQPGQKVLIVGASGGVGSYAVQLARCYGAQVTGVCSTANLDLVTSLGADHVIDYTSQDFTRNGETYDVIFDTVGKSRFQGAGTHSRRLDCILLARTVWMHSRRWRGLHWQAAGKSWRVWRRTAKPT